MKTELTYEESLVREQGVMFTCDFSEQTLLAVAHSKNCLKALSKQIPKKKIYNGDDYNCPVCGDLAKTTYCGNCGQRLDWDDPK